MKRAPMHATLVFSVLGPAFLCAAAVQWYRGTNPPRVRAWAIVGLLFSLIGGWLWLH